MVVEWGPLKRTPTHDNKCHFYILSHYIPVSAVIAYVHRLISTNDKHRMCPQCGYRYNCLNESDIDGFCTNRCMRKVTAAPWEGFWLSNVAAQFTLYHGLLVGEDVRFVHFEGNGDWDREE
ncbi:hypothetical protein HK097_006843, partial [Rhizophlyctis rosea]